MIFIIKYKHILGRESMNMHFLLTNDSPSFLLFPLSLTLDSSSTVIQCRLLQHPQEIKTSQCAMIDQCGCICLWTGDGDQ